MINVAVAGIGKMGLSHLSIVRAHPDVRVAALCDSATYLLDVLSKQAGVCGFNSYPRMLDECDLDAVVIATPTHLHASMVHAALDHGLDVFCEKPLAMAGAEGAQLAEHARANAAVTQVGYHNRFVASFAEVQRLLAAGAIGKVTHGLAEAYGPVVLKAKGSTWRSKRSSGGGCLNDYAAHPLDLLCWYLGEPEGVSGSLLSRIFSAETEDEVYSTINFAGGVTAHLTVNWSDESQRKMSTAITLWGTHGRIYADRQEVQVYRRAGAPPIDGYGPGWTVHYTTELTRPVWFYLRGEEYSAQIDAFVGRVQRREPNGVNDFDSARVTDQLIDLIREDAGHPHVLHSSGWVRQPAAELVGAEVEHDGGVFGSRMLRRLGGRR